MRGFLFGKLPGFGDFVARGMSPRVRSWWDRWSSAAIVDARRRFGDRFDEDYQATMPRRFLIPASDDGPWQAGCIHASSDMAGRAFPFVLGVASLLPIDPVDGAAIGNRIAACLGMALDRHLDLAVLTAAAEAAARDAAQEARPILPVRAADVGWIGDRPERAGA
jgi:type VI secretion system ImpM family protein